MSEDTPSKKMADDRCCKKQRLRDPPSAWFPQPTTQPTTVAQPVASVLPSFSLPPSILPFATNSIPPKRKPFQNAGLFREEGGLAAVLARERI